MWVPQMLPGLVPLTWLLPTGVEFSKELDNVAS